MPAINLWNESTVCTRRPLFKDVIQPIKSTHTIELDISPEAENNTEPNGSDNLPLQEMSPVENDSAVCTEPETCKDVCYQGGDR